MSNNYSVRIRGRVHGPFPLEKARELVRKGQIGRMHEVSVDGHTWAPAADSPELFEATPVTPSVAVMAATPAVAPSRTSGEEGEDWFYSKGSGSIGPHSFADLERFAEEGRISAADDVWDPSKGDWVEASSIPGLARRLPSRGHHEMGGGARAGESQSASLLKVSLALGASAGWKLFASLWCLLVGAGALIFGLFGLSASGSNPVTPIVSFGILGGGVIVTLLGSFLLNAHTRISAATYAPNDESISLAIRAENRFWLTASLCLIVATLAAVVGGVLLVYPLRFVS